MAMPKMRVSKKRGFKINKLRQSKKLGKSGKSKKSKKVRKSKKFMRLSKNIRRLKKRKSRRNKLLRGGAGTQELIFSCNLGAADSPFEYYKDLGEGIGNNFMLVNEILFSTNSLRVRDVLNYIPEELKIIINDKYNDADPAMRLFCPDYFNEKNKKDGKGGIYGEDEQRNYVFNADKENKPKICRFNALSYPWSKNKLKKGTLVKINGQPGLTTSGRLILFCIDSGISVVQFLDLFYGTGTITIGTETISLERDCINEGLSLLNPTHTDYTGHSAEKIERTTLLWDMIQNVNMFKYLSRFSPISQQLRDLLNKVATFDLGEIFRWSDESGLKNADVFIQEASAITESGTNPYHKTHHLYYLDPDVEIDGESPECTAMLINKSNFNGSDRTLHFYSAYNHQNMRYKHFDSLYANSDFELKQINVMDENYQYYNIRENETLKSIGKAEAKQAGSAEARQAGSPPQQPARASPDTIFNNLNAELQGPMKTLLIKSTIVYDETNNKIYINIHMKDPKAKVCAKNYGCLLNNIISEIITHKKMPEANIARLGIIIGGDSNLEKFDHVDAIISELNNSTARGGYEQFNFNPPNAPTVRKMRNHGVTSQVKKMMSGKCFGKDLFITNIPAINNPSTTIIEQARTGSIGPWSKLNPGDHYFVSFMSGEPGAPSVFGDVLGSLANAAVGFGRSVFGSVSVRPVAPQDLFPTKDSNYYPQVVEGTRKISLPPPDAPDDTPITDTIS